MNSQAILETLAGTFCCANDQLLTVKEWGCGLSFLTGYSPEELEHQFQKQLSALIIPESRHTVRQALAEQLAQEGEAELEFQLLHKKGHRIWVLAKCRLLSKDNCEYVYGLMTDITKSRSFYAHTSKALEQYQTILAQTENIVFEWDFQQDSMFFSDTWKEILGYPPVTQNFSRYLQESPRIHPEDLPDFLEQLQALQTGSSYRSRDIRIQKASGEYLWFRIRATAFHGSDGRLLKIIGIILNVDAEKKAAYALKARAERDALTKLLNQATARQLAEQYLNPLTDTPHCALLIIDLDNFKQVNDYSGHLFGDTVLVQTACEIQKLFRSQDIIARIGGDEFLVLMKDISDTNLVEMRCRQLLDVVQNLPLETPVPYRLSCSIGIAFSPLHGSSYYELFQHADQALYQAKALGKCCYSICSKEAL